MVKLVHCIILFLIAFTVSATSYNVGPGHAYLTPNAIYQADIAQDGDTILIEGIDYYGQEALAHWTADRLYILGVNGTPHLHADGQYILGKGIWVCGGNDITIDNIEFSEAAVPDKNGAGIRHDGIGLTVRNCYFHDNETGILTNSPYDGHILVEYSEFGHNGNGDGQSHNIYVNHADTFTFQYNYTHHAMVGHCIKSRADYNFIKCNRIMDEDDGNSSRLIDIPNGGQCVIIGNTMMQGPGAPNYNMIGYGLEGLINDAPHKLYVVNNTMVSTRSSALFFHVQDGTESALAANNILAGNGILVDGTLTIESVNAHYTEISNAGFIDVDAHNYRLSGTAAARDMGLPVGVVDGSNLDVDSEYVHPQASKDRFIDTAIDLGAFEYESPNNIQGISSDSKIVYPNPSADSIFFAEPSGDVKILNDQGVLIWECHLPVDRVDVSTFVSGIYTIVKSGLFYCKIVIL